VETASKKPGENQGNPKKRSKRGGDWGGRGTKKGLEKRKLMKAGVAGTKQKATWFTASQGEKAR